MKHPFDPALKTLTELGPVDWLPLARRRRRRVTIEDSDIGTIVSGAADKLFRVHDDPEYLLHLDFEAGHFRTELPLRLRLYYSVFEYRHDCVVLSVPVLLCPSADSPKWTGLLERGLPGEEPISTLRYEVIRVWTLPADELLKGGVGTLALAPISDVSEGQVRGVVRRMEERLTGTQAPRLAKDVMAAAYVLLGLRYTKDFANALFKEVLGMKESTTYQAIVDEGRIDGARLILLTMGETMIGPPDAATRAVIEKTDDLAQLEELALRLPKAGSWQELLASPTPRRRKSSRRSKS